MHTDRNLRAGRKLDTDELCRRTERSRGNKPGKHHERCAAWPSLFCLNHDSNCLGRLSLMESLAPWRDACRLRYVRRRYLIYSCAASPRLFAVTIRRTAGTATPVQAIPNTAIDRGMPVLPRNTAVPMLLSKPTAFPVNSTVRCYASSKGWLCPENGRSHNMRGCSSAGGPHLNTAPKTSLR
jgi:hypothetical protein